MPKILIIDDEEMMRDLLSSVAKSLGHEAESAGTISQGMREAQSNFYDVIFLDIGLPDGNGLDILPQLRSADSSPEVIIVTGSADSNGAELAIKNGAWDYIKKGSSLESITLPLIRALQYRSEKHKRQTVSFKREGIVGNSLKLKNCLDRAAIAVNNETAVLIAGESGTGKELFAWAIHNNGARAQKNFVVVDCAALPDTLVESILFGHEKGSFTGADKFKEGLIAQAHGGTLFLDEVGELPLSLQKSFLRVLQEHRFRPVGGDKELDSNFRLISATNKNLKESAKKGEFRLDLLYRIQSIQIDLPPLRERKKDIQDIVAYRLTKLVEQSSGEAKTFSPDFFEALMAYDWPGNNRELNNAIDRAYFASGNDCRLYPQHLPDHIRVFLANKNFKTSSETAPSSIRSNSPSTDLPTLREHRKLMEKEYLLSLMAVTGGYIAEACRISGLSRSGLYNLLQKYQISKEEN